MIVVDTTVLSNLALANRLDLLEEFHKKIVIPSQVHEEVLKGIAAGYDFLLFIMAFGFGLGRWG